MSGRLAVCALGLSAVLLAPPAQALVSTAMDASFLPFVSCNGRVGFRVGEAQQGGTDLNGDTDAIDFVFHVLDLTTSVVTNVGVEASGVLACAGDVFAFGVRESGQGTADRNGDLDTSDYVLATYDAGTATLTNIGVAVSAIAASPQLFAFTVGEASQGNADRNGDLDVFDQVLAVLDPATLVVTNVQLEASDTNNITVNGQRVGFIVSESAQGNNNLNGDADTADTVAYFYDAPTSTVTSSGRAVVPALGIALDSAVAAFVVSEAAQGSSFNGDPDTADQVVAIYCFGGPPCPTPGLTNIGVDASGGIRLAGDLLAFRTREGNEPPGPSLNPPDADRGDFVVQYYRIGTGTLVSSGLASKASFRIIGDKIAIGVPENKQGHADRNGDADSRDIVLAIYDTLTTATTNTGRALWAKTCRPEPKVGRPRGTCLMSGDDMVVFPNGERAQGADLNGDTDRRDAVLSAWRISTATLVTGRAGEHKTTLLASGTLAAFRISEARENAILNGDGDKTDDVIGVYDDTTGLMSQLGRAVDAPLVIEGRTVVFRTNEFLQNADLNFDGDKSDAILEYETFP